MKGDKSFLFDTNVIIDALSGRTGDNKKTRDLLRRVLTKDIKGYLVSKQITDIYYVLRRYIPDDSERRKVISVLLDVFEILPLIKGELTYSLSLPFNDYEDAIIYETAKINCVNAIVTNNMKDFSNSKILIMSPNELWEIQNAMSPF